MEPLEKRQRAKRIVKRFNIEEEIRDKYPRVYDDYLNVVPVLNTNKEELEKLLKLKTEFDTTKAQLVDMIVEQKKINEKQEAQIKDMYEFVHKTYDPVMEMLNELADTPDGKELIEKLNAKKQAKIE